VLLFLYDNFLTSIAVWVLKTSGCTHALFTVDETVKYFTKRGSKVYCSFLGASKAFDKVLHNGVFKKLLDRGIPVNFVKLLRYWYSNLQRRVKWNNVLGDIFPVLCGVRQGGVLSPILFALYIDGVISELKLSGHGVHIFSLYL